MKYATSQILVPFGSAGHGRTRGFSCGSLGLIGLVILYSVLLHFIMIRGVPEHIRSDNVPEFIAAAVRGFLGGGGGRDLQPVFWSTADATFGMMFGICTRRPE